MNKKMWGNLLHRREKKKTVGIFGYIHLFIDTIMVDLYRNTTTTFTGERRPLSSSMGKKGSSTTTTTPPPGGQSTAMMLEPFPRNTCVGKLFATSKRLGGTCRGHEVTYDAKAMQVIRAFLQRTSCVSPDDETVCKIAIVPHVAPKKDAKRGWHFRKRRFWCRNDAPRWLLASKVLPSWVFGGGQKHADTDKKRAPLEGLEICEWHEEEKRLYTYTRNISLRKMIVCEELAVIKECPEDANKCVKACEVRIRVAFRGPWLFGLHKIAERWVAKRYERLVKETSRMEVNRIESLKKMEEYIKEMLAGTKAAPSLEKIEKFVSACERTNQSSTTASSLDSSVNMSLSPDGAVKTRAASSATKKKENEIEIEKREKDERGEKYQGQARSEIPRSSTTTEYMEPCSFGDEDFANQPGAASSLREGEEEEEEEQRRVIVHREDRDKENPTSPPSRNTTTKTPENQAKQPLRVLFHSKNFKVEVE